MGVGPTTILDKQLEQCAEFAELDQWNVRTELLDEHAKRTVCMGV